MLNQVERPRIKATIQTVTYLPYFISTVVLVAMLQLFLSPERGLYGALMDMMGVQNPVDPNTSPSAVPYSICCFQHLADHRFFQYCLFGNAVRRRPVPV